MTPGTAAPGPSIVFFDGVCNLCTGVVRFVIPRDPRGRFRFVALRSEAAERLLEPFGDVGEGGEPGSVLVLEGGRLYARSDAALRLARGLTFPWPLAYGLVVVPRPVRDAVYGLIARNRYRLFGRTDSCMVPSPALRARFLV